MTASHARPAHNGWVLERYLADLSSLRADLRRAPTERRAAAVVYDRWGSRGVTQFSVHLFATAEPTRRGRSRWSFAVDRDVGFDGDWYGVATVHGVIEPGAAVAVSIDDLVIWPGGPLRPLMRGVRWRA